MSKAKTLGAGRFGSTTAAPVSARRQAVAAATGVPTEGVAPPTELPVDRISLNPDNPRSALGDLTELAGSLKEHGQKQAITVMNRDAYIRANPVRESELEPHATHVVIDGSSRLAAAREAGLPTVKVWVDDDQGADSEALLESALVANVHRQDLAELDEARALQRLLAIHGSQSALAKRLHKSQGWVSQRLALLNLTPELQAKIGQEPIKLLRAVGNKPAEQQADALEELKRQQAEKEAARSSRRPQQPAPETLAEPTGYYPVMDLPPAQADTAAPSQPTAPASSRPKAEPSVVPSTPRPAGTSTQTALEPARPVQAVPEPRPAPEVKKFPYDNPGEAALLLAHKMDGRSLLEVWQRLGAHLGRTDREARDKVAQTLLDDDPSQ
ncbi:ParB/RepB/Spo0J family partition protein (plasmid) [Streptomyces cellulosae]|uniref:ParB/RepB/Spo0J family partition protein n=1 Tax=Streptomyces cellulosae TaxID=1968 RepID=UPI002ED19A38|nr:ParB/RepB/Spo0J family partition protein [Streptomyces cellulosae]WTB73700.1 ParB/RepB/Spo0J family partition protein [Streptomyces cellulosae]